MSDQSQPEPGAVFDVEAILRDRETRNVPFHEFLSVPKLSMGVYKLAAGADDPQMPHAEDEIYYVLEGKAHIRIHHEVRPIKSGSIIYVQAKAPHRFIDIEEDLTVLVFFAPAHQAQS